MTAPRESTCRLNLSNGQSFEGRLIGAPLESSGELVFTTGMVGYSEALTDPSYYGQILVFTYPLIGNYGIPELPNHLPIENSRGFESDRVHVAAVIVADDSREAFHWTSHQTLDVWLKEHAVPGIVGLDPRQLVHLIRENRGLSARVVPDKSSGKRIFGFETAPNYQDLFFDPSAHQVISAVSSKERKVIGTGKKRIAVIDCGVKWNILRQLIKQGAEVEIIPYDTDLSDVDCSGWLISNGPGDPKKTGDLKHRIAALLEHERPVLGICLGHQLLALAAGADTVRMNYGHRSHNQPVQLVGSRKGFITSQNHGYVVDGDTLPSDWEAWFVNGNDQTIEGIRHRVKPHRSVQFHPEAAGGPRDTGWIIEQFVKEI
ncbi:MAG: glutamine-hydrolyzing carbamoyl-phosphate synthase small subunit [Proteobacteria bacterium]|nr:glutamine-hydrolyzing carbamoyl-phosphate synthase small subunit [Pseudomonadota bacterium]